MDHKELDAWNESVELSLLIYSVTKSFPKEEQYGLTQQIRRSAVSVPSNIAEGCARKSTKETIWFIYIALGSLAELETQIIISHRLGFVDSADIVQNQIVKVKQIILGLIRYLKKTSNN